MSSSLKESVDGMGGSSLYPVQYFFKAIRHSFVILERSEYEMHMVRHNHSGVKMDLDIMIV